MHEASKSSDSSVHGVLMMQLSCCDAAGDVLTECTCHYQEVYRNVVTNMNGMGFAAHALVLMGGLYLGTQIVTVAAYHPCITLRIVLSLISAVPVTMTTVLYSSLHGKSCACILLRMRHDRRPIRTR